MRNLDMLAFILLVVGGVNWGLHALGFNLVELLLGQWPTLVMVVYLLIGASAVYVAYTHQKELMGK